MYEDRPEKDTPLSISKALREYGGVSPDGQSIWQFVLAQNCRMRCFGTMNHIDPSLIAAMTDETRPTDIVPDRIEDGEFWLPRYKVRGWILRRWFPASAWGTREQWESERAKDGRTRMLAAYPQRGDYMMMPCGPWKTIAEAGDLKAAIRCYNVQQRENPVNWQNHMLAWIAMDAQQRQQDADDFSENLADEYRLGVSPVLRSVSESAQAFRDTIADYAAGGVHLGSSEKWG